MQFTPQQLNGGPKYSSKSLIGNWYEEVALEDCKLSDFQRKSANGELYLRKQQAKFSKCTQKVPHSYPRDGLIRIGDTMMLQHRDTGTSLACDPYEDIFPEMKKFQVTAVNAPNPVARNTFRIMRPAGSLRSIEDDENDDILRYGQGFHLGCNESLLISSDGRSMAPTLYLASTIKNERTITRVSNRQAAYMNATCNADTVWYCMKPSQGKVGGTERFCAMGSPVYADDPFVLIHRATNTYLSTDPTKAEQTDFGFEFEAFNKRDSTNGKLSLMQAEFSGTGTAATIQKKDNTQNIWFFHGSDNEAAAEEFRAIPSPPTYDDVLEEMRNAIRYSGINGYVRLRRKLIDIDSDVGGGCSDGKVDMTDIIVLLSEYGVTNDNKRMEIVMKEFDRRNIALVDYREFLDELRPELPQNRREFLQNLFKKLQVNNDSTMGENEIEFEALKGMLHMGKHPSVLNGEFGVKQMHYEYFAKVITTTNKVVRKQKSVIVLLSNFIHYFADYSPVIEDDAEFECFVTSLF